MRILILGGLGMLGHQLWLSLQRKHEVWVTVRTLSRELALGHDPARTLAGIDVTNSEALTSAFRAARPDVVVNCVGIIKQLPEAQNPLLTLKINAVLPHQLAQLCAVAGSRLVHISTDCVFSGKKGSYTEEDFSDADDIYGRTKFLGEVFDAHCVTLRTSIIGRELSTRLGLIEWFLNQRGLRIRGFRKAIYSGLTTMELARIIDIILQTHPNLCGLWHVSSDSINKYELLSLAKRAFRWDGEIEPDDTIVSDRSLDSSRFRQRTGYRPPSWQTMLDEMSSEETYS